MTIKDCIDKLICRVIGHDADLIDVYNCTCFRCGYTWDDYQEPPRCDYGFWLTLYGFRAGRWWRFVARPWLRCPYCACRFGRHDHDRCLPF